MACIEPVVYDARVMRFDSWLVLGVFALLLPACTDRVDGETLDEIVIPVDPVSRGDVEYLTVEIDEGDVVRFDRSLTLAVGQEYPSEFAVQFAPSLFLASCGSFTAQMSVHELTDPSKVVKGSNEEGIVLSIRSAGTAELVLKGELTIEETQSCELPVGRPIRFEGSIAVRAIRPAGVVFDSDRCEAEVPLVAPSTKHSLSIHLVDENGEVFVANNARGDRQATVRLRGALTTPPTAPASLGEWTPLLSGLVEVVPSFGSALQIDVIDPARVTAVTIDFQLAARHLASPITIETGASYGEGGWEDMANRLSPRIHDAEVDGVPLCSFADSSWFELVSNTPDVCEIMEAEAAESKLVSFDGIGTGQTARLKKDGTCSLDLRAPELAPDGGFPLSVSATFRNIADLHDW
jgi:hypothetical protein